MWLVLCLVIFRWATLVASHMMWLCSGRLWRLRCICWRRHGIRARRFKCLLCGMRAENGARRIWRLTIDDFGLTIGNGRFSSVSSPIYCSPPQPHKNDTATEGKRSTKTARHPRRLQLPKTIPQQAVDIYLICTYGKLY